VERRDHEQEVVTATAPAKIKTSEDGTGPFGLKEWKTARRSRWPSTPATGQAEAVSGHRRVPADPDESSRVAALRSNAIQMTTFRDPRVAKDAQNAGATWARASGPRRTGSG